LRVAIKADCHYSGFWLLDSAVCKTAPPTRRFFKLLFSKKNLHIFESPVRFALVLAVLL